MIFLFFRGNTVYLKCSTQIFISQQGGAQVTSDAEDISASSQTPMVSQNERVFLLYMIYPLSSHIAVDTAQHPTTICEM